MKKTISRFYLLLVLVPLLLLASMGGYYFLEETAAGSDVVVVPQTPAPPSATPVPVPTPEPTPTPFPEHDITLMAVGDNLMHLGIVASGKQEDGTYDFSMLFQGISPFLNAADIRIINQETVMGGNCRTEGIAGKRTDCRAGCPGGDHEHHTSHYNLYLKCGAQTGNH